MNVGSITMKIKNIEEQLIILREQLETEQSKKRPQNEKCGLSSLANIWKGQPDVTDEDIEAVKYKMKGFPEDKI